MPNVAICTPGSSVTWSLVWPASKPTGHSIEIEFATTNGLKGPFPKGAGAKDNPAPGRYSDKVTGGTKISTLPSRQPTDTFWKYTVTLRDASDNDVTTLDPIVIFK